jgi:hypothetical protein
MERGVEEAREREGEVGSELTLVEVCSTSVCELLDKAGRLAVPSASSTEYAMQLPIASCADRQEAASARGSLLKHI